MSGNVPPRNLCLTLSFTLGMSRIYWHWHHVFNFCQWHDHRHRWQCAWNTKLKVLLNRTLNSIRMIYHQLLTSSSSSSSAPIVSSAGWTSITTLLTLPLNRLRDLTMTIFHPQKKLYDTYPNSDEEQRYWHAANRGLRSLRRSDARFVGSERPKNVRVPEMPPLVMYYVPALLPRYRDNNNKKLPSYETEENK